MVIGKRALYDIMSPDIKKPYKGAKQWNPARIVVKGNKVQHWLNGIKILEFEKGIFGE